MRNSLLLSFALPFFMLLVPSPGLTQIEEEPRTTRVRVADLDLSSRAGQRKLDRRIYNAALSVCGNPYEFLISTNCVKEAVRWARPGRDFAIAQSKVNRTDISDMRVPQSKVDAAAEADE